jgi:hypothetical protein
MDILEEMEGKAVIWAHYRHDIKNIVNALEKNILVKQLLTMEILQLKIDKKQLN